jgi:hypothetical protein
MSGRSSDIETGGMAFGAYSNPSKNLEGHGRSNEDIFVVAKSTRVRLGSIAFNKLSRTVHHQLFENCTLRGTYARKCKSVHPCTGLFVGPPGLTPGVAAR